MLGPFPNRGQIHLLRAAVGPITEARAAWERLASFPNLTNDSTFKKVSPHLFERRECLGLSFDFLTAAGKARTAADLEQAARMRVLVPVARTLGTEQIFLLKGVASNQIYANRMAPRFMADIDICVPRGEARISVQRLVEAGWEPQYEHTVALKGVSPFHYFPYRHSMPFRHPSIRDTLDLHWAVLRLAPQAQWDHELFAFRSEITIQGHRFQVLDATGRLFHSLVHGLEWRRRANVNWVLDAAAILTCDSVEYERLSYLASRWGVLPALQAGLDFLQREVGLPCSRITGRGTRLDRLEYRIKSSPLNARLFGGLPFVLFQFRRTGGLRSSRSAVWQRYLHHTRRVIRFHWGVGSLKDMLSGVWLKLWGQGEARW